MMNPVNITKNPHLVHTDLSWEELKKVLKIVGEFNRFGHPNQSQVDEGNYGINPQQPDQIWVDEDHLFKIQKLVKEFLNEQ